MDGEYRFCVILNVKLLVTNWMTDGIIVIPDRLHNSCNFQTLGDKCDYQILKTLENTEKFLQICNKVINLDYEK